MSKKKKILFVFGTRPETIKLASLIHRFKRNSKQYETLVAVTGQHKEMLDQALDLFDIEPNYNLAVMEYDQDLTALTNRILEGVADLIQQEKPDLILVQGDTTTTFAASLAGFYQSVPVAHVEAGLRSNNMFSPFPEEVNRKITSIVSHYHFPPTCESKDNLVREGVSEDLILVSGNTVIDALSIVLRKFKSSERNTLYKDFFLNTYGIEFKDNIKTILVTGHRRESFGEGFYNICEAIKSVSLENDDIQIIYPVHLNPNVQKPVFSVLKNCKNVYLIDPQEYESFVFLMNNAYIILTDSGGVQEEAPTLGKPVLVMRENTERNEGIVAGTAKLVGVKSVDIIKNIKELLNNKNLYSQMATSINPYGDGKAAEKIYQFLIKRI